MAALNHPHIAAMYDVGPNYFVMEFVPGQALQQLIPPKGLPLRQALEYAGQIAEAVAAAHAAGTVHRDLKPGNIMVTAEGRVKVVDFGLARVTAPKIASPHDPTFTQTADGAIAGTVSYMSPEQAQGKSIDERSDIFSFGAVLHEMLTGVRAFQGETPMSTAAEIIDKEPRPASEIASHMPRDLEELLARCLRKDPARRWQKMADIGAALDEMMEAPSRRRVQPMWLAAAAGRYFARSPKPDTFPLAAVPLTSYPGHQAEPSFSPDGTPVAFSWDGPARDNWDIYFKVVGEGEPLRLTSNPAADLRPAWSADGKWIAFARELPEGRYALMLVSPLGGGERKLGEFGSPKGMIPRSTGAATPATSCFRFATSEAATAFFGSPSTQASCGN